MSDAFVCNTRHDNEFAASIELCGGMRSHNVAVRAAACNRHIKFGALLRFAKAMGADCIATGHYARLRHDPDGASAHDALLSGGCTEHTLFQRLLTPRYQPMTMTSTVLSAAQFAAGGDPCIIHCHPMSSPITFAQPRCAPHSAGGPSQLLTGADPLKDQSYFLASVPGAALRDVLFPLGALRKADVRRVAAEAGVPSAHRRSSAGLCFVGV